MTVDRKQRVINEVWSAITHGVGAALGIWMLVLLILKGAATHDLKTIMAFIVYGTSMLSFVFIFDFVPLSVFYESKTCLSNI